MPPTADIAVGTVVDLLAQRDPGAPALLCADGVVSRTELAAGANRAARELAALGVGPGDLVTIGLANGASFYYAVVGAWKLGAVPQPVSAKLPPAELAALVELAGTPVVVGLPAPDGRPWLPPDWMPDPSLSPEPLPPVVPPSWKAPTSGGSTGRPKIIIAGGAGTLATLTARASELRIGGDGEVFAVTAPLYHNAPFMFSLIALVRGCPLLVLDRFDGASVLDAIVRHRVSWFYAVPTLMGRILRLPAAVRAAADLSSVHTLLHVGAPCPPHVKRAWIDWLGPGRVLELYAGTESLAVCMINGVQWLARPGSVGRPVRGEIMIGDGDGRPLAVGTVGEVWMRGPAGAPTYRYLGATAREHDGWTTIGDLGQVDADGYLYLADRRDDLILVGGANVYPAEVEAALDEHPAVLSSCVIGLPDDDLGARVHAIVQLDGARAGTEGPGRDAGAATRAGVHPDVTAGISDDELRAHLAARLVPAKVPTTFERVHEALRDDAGKVRRSALRAARLR